MAVRTLSLVFAAFGMGALVGLAAAPKKNIAPVLYQGKAPQEAAAALLPLAKESAEDGSWENIYNLKGDRAKAEELFARSFKIQSNSIWNSAKVAGSYVGVIPQ